jgi:hypothetical protein
MNDSERQESKWIGKAGWAGCIVAIVLGEIGFFASGRGDPLMGGAVMMGFLGYVVGLSGAAARTPLRAGFVGVCVFGLPTLVWYWHDPVQVYVWRLAGVASLGSILCQVGAVASGTAACGANQKKKIQFTVQQFLMFFIPVAIYFGYVSTLMRK